MVVGAKVGELTDGFLWFGCGLHVGILTSPHIRRDSKIPVQCVDNLSQCLVTGDTRVRDV